MVVMEVAGLALVSTCRGIGVGRHGIGVGRLGIGVGRLGIGEHA